MLEGIPYDFEMEKIIEFIKKGNYNRIILQFPEGLKQYSTQIYELLRQEFKEKTFYIYGDHSWGSCDIPFQDASLIGAELIVHFGHTPYSMQPAGINIPKGIDVLYVPSYSKLVISEELLDKLVEKLVERGLRKPILTSTIQHTRQLNEIKAFLENRGLKPVLEKTPDMEYGQIIGCDYRLIRLKGNHDSVVIVSGGKFHALGAALSTNLPVIQLDPYSGIIEDLEKMREKWLKERYGVIYKAMEATNWGIWAGSMSGQYRETLIRYLKKLIEEKRGKWFLFYSRYVNKAVLSNLDNDNIHAHIITSCPRVPIDDFVIERYHKPVLSPGEAIMVLTGKLEEYRFMW